MLKPEAIRSYTRDGGLCDSELLVSEVTLAASSHISQRLKGRELQFMMDRARINNHHQLIQLLYGEILNQLNELKSDVRQAISVPPVLALSNPDLLDLSGRRIYERLTELVCRIEDQLK